MTAIPPSAMAMNTQRSVSRYGTSGRTAACVSARTLCATSTPAAPIRLIDFGDIEQNSFVVTQQFTFRAGKTEKRPDLMLLVNGLPLVLIEAKTPVRSSQSWLDGALQVHDDYDQNVPELFVPNVFSVATEGKEYRYGSVRMPVDLWGPWRTDEDVLQSMGEVEKAVSFMMPYGVSGGRKLSSSTSSISDSATEWQLCRCTTAPAVLRVS